jgi:hypothetical protein
MSADQLCTHDDAGRSSSLLLERLQRSRPADDDAAPEQFAPGLRAVDAGCAIVEQARGALVLHYGIDSYQTKNRQRPLIRWLEDQLRLGDPELA